MALGPVGTPEVSYLNRSGEYASTAAAGWYHVVVKMSPVWTDGVAVPDAQPAFEIVVTVTGQATAGPEYGQANVPSSAPPAPRTRSDWTPPRAAAEVVRSAVEVRGGSPAAVVPCWSSRSWC